MSEPLIESDLNDSTDVCLQHYNHTGADNHFDHLNQVQ